MDWKEKDLVIAFTAGVIWVVMACGLGFLREHDLNTIRHQTCVLDQTLVNILDPGYKHLTARQRSLLQTDIDALVQQAPCDVTYIPLPKGTK